MHQRIPLLIFKLIFLLSLLPLPTSTQRLWGGTSSYFLHTLQDTDRGEVLDAVKDAGLKVIRIFISTTGENNKGSGSRGVNDIEQDKVGVYDDTILGLIDQLMYDAFQRGIKLTISMHDRYQLGCWGSDAYVKKYNIPTSDCGSSPNKNNATIFYTNQNAQNDFDNRLHHILNHTNPHFSNRPWKQLHEVVFSFEAQNEAMGHISLSNPQWQCNRAKTIKSLLTTGGPILVTTGGGAAFEDSWIDEYFSCPYIDVLSGHNYNSNGNYISTAVSTARSKADSAGKRIIVEEFGCSGGKTGCFNSQMDVIYSLNVPWMFWEVLKPGNDNDYETWTNEDAWGGAIVPQAKKAAATYKGWNWPEIWG